MPATARLFCCVPFLLLGLSHPQSLEAQESPPESLDALRKQFAEQRLVLEQPVTELNQLYEKQLGALREKVKADGDLEKTLLVDQEIREYRNPGHAPRERFAEIDRLHEIYVAELQKRQAAVAERLPSYLNSYLEQLDALSKELTRKDRLAEAVAAREEASLVRQQIENGATAGTPALDPASIPAGGGRLKGIGFGSKEDPLGIPPRGDHRCGCHQVLGKGDFRHRLGRPPRERHGLD